MRFPFLVTMPKVPHCSPHHRVADTSELTFYIELPRTELNVHWGNPGHVLRQAHSSIFRNLQPPLSGQTNEPDSPNFSGVPARRMSRTGKGGAKRWKGLYRHRLRRLVLWSGNHAHPEQLVRSPVGFWSRRTLEEKQAFSCVSSFTSSLFPRE